MNNTKSKIHINKVYTKAGDQGTTHLIGSLGKISKASLRVEAYGSCDELIAHLGLALSLFNEYSDDFKSKEKTKTIVDGLSSIQNNLFDLGNILATHPNYAKKKQFSPTKIKVLEEMIDEFNEALPPLDSFVLAGGHQLNSQLHICRTVCRRVERWTVRLYHKYGSIDLVLIQYLNRLSDLLFTLARWVSIELGEKEVLWEPGK